jgi:uncharacterized membrane protein YbaN (DUF454 family)|tara:strand:- start:3179 stop:3562 length:384 start_codon:yes stop_codon:yes gene_type:complete
MSEIKRICWVGLGVLCVIIGAIGVIVPGLPTTVFVLIALWAFAKSSPRLYIWLLNNKILAGSAKKFMETGTMTTKLKTIIISCILIFCSISILFILPQGLVTIKSMIFIVGIIGILYILHIPVAKEK